MELREKFREWLAGKRLSDRTIHEYSYYYDRFPFHDDITQENVNEFIFKFKDNGIARAFLKNYIRFLYKNYEDKSHLSLVEVERQTGRKKRKIPRYVTEEEVKEISKSFTKEKYVLMLFIGFYSGMRSQGLMNLRPCDFNWKDWNKNRNRPLKVKVSEKGAKERIVFIPSHVAKALAWYIQNKRSTIGAEDPLFSAHLTSKKKLAYETWYNYLNKHSKKTIGRKVNPHQLRHGCATWLMERGWDLKEIKEYLGHENISTTEIYMHINRTEMRNKFQDIFNNPSMTETSSSRS